MGVKVQTILPRGRGTEEGNSKCNNRVARVFELVNGSCIDGYCRLLGSMCERRKGTRKKRQISIWRNLWGACTD